MSKTELFTRYRIYLLIGVAVLLVGLNMGSPGVIANSKATQLVAPTRLADTTQPSTLPLTHVATDPLRDLLTAQFDRPMLEPAARDPFNVAPPAPVVSVKAPAPAPVAPPAPPTVQAPPPHDLTFAGRMTRPDGGEVFYVNYAGASLSIVAGQSLPNGYRIESISARAIELSHPSLHSTTRIDVPDAPKYETR